MNICSMRAQTLKGDLYEFTIQDMPVITGEDSLVLLNRRFSPILKPSTLRLGSDVGVYIGDVLRDRDKSEWAVVFKMGMFAVNLKTKENRMLYDFDKLVVTRQMTAEEEANFNYTPPKLKFKFQGSVFTLLDIAGRYQNRMLVLGLTERVSPDEIQQDAGVSINGARIYYGDLYKGLPVFMCYGRVCVQNEFGVFDILEGKYIMKTGGNKQWK